MGGMSTIKRVYNRVASAALKNRVAKLRRWIRRFSSDPEKIRLAIERNCRLEKQLKGKQRIEVAFFIMREAGWKYDSLFELLRRDERFSPYVVVCPFKKEDEKTRIEILLHTQAAFRQKGYEVITPYDTASGEWLDLRKTIQPDLIFWGFPYDGQTDDIYFIEAFAESLSCYVPYFFGSVTCRWAFDLLFHNMVWKLFCETPYHYEMYKKKSRLKGQNVYVTGYPPADCFVQKEQHSNFRWKKEGLLCLIWAPHHSIEKGGYSNFLRFADEMQAIAAQYKDHIQIVFKPHPQLRFKLYDLKVWDKERIDQYYDSWNQLENGMLWEGEYVDLFNTSDALMHDSGSFTIEYLYTLKPVYYFTGRNRVKDLNQFGKTAYDLHYQGETREQLLQFIGQVIHGEDPRLEERKAFYDRYLLSPNGQTAARNIYDKLCSYL